ncbi:type II secretion system protein GspD [Candidatus Omnitrophota bacterium]
MIKRYFTRDSRWVRLLVVIVFLFGFVNNMNAQEARRVSMDFQDAALKDVLKIFSQQAGLNFVATENIESKRITLYLDGVSVQDALDSIISANNLTYEQAPGSAVFIVKESGRARVEMLTKVYPINFARLSDVAVTGSGKSQISDIKTVLETILSKNASGQPFGNIVVDKRTNSIVVTSIADDFSVIEETINKLDTLTPQALIEAEIVEIKTNALKSLGLEWGGTSDGTFVSFTGPIRSTKFPFIRKSGPFVDRLISGAEDSHTLGTMSLAEFSLVIKALETEGNAQYLAKPRIMALNNETAEIKITSDTVVGVKRTSVTDTGEVIEEAERVETGITLKVTPTINKEGYVTMTLEPEVSRAIQSNFFSQFVDPAKRSAKTTVMVKNGQTIAIGGLLQTDEENSNRQTPYVSHIPFLGKLFRRKQDTISKTELIIFITAHMIKDVTEILPEPVEDFTTQKEEADLVLGDAPVLERELLGAPVQEPPFTEDEKKVADIREEEIKKTVLRLRKKRDISKR